MGIAVNILSNRSVINNGCAHEIVCFVAPAQKNEATGLYPLKQH
jgi:hypothetical protein